MAGDDCLHNFWREQLQSKNAAEIGVVDLFSLCQFGRRFVFAAFDHLPLAVRANDGFEQGAVHARGG